MPLVRGCQFSRSVAECKRKVFEPIVHPGLSITPSQIELMSRDGVAVSVPNANNFFHEQDSSGWNVDPAFQRDSDRNSVWESSRLARANILTARRKDKEKYG